MNRITTSLLLAGAAAFALLPLNAGASSGISEWGLPTYTGGPGSTPTVDQSVTPTQIDAGDEGNVYVSGGNVYEWGQGGSSSTPTLITQGSPNTVTGVTARPVDGAGNFSVLVPEVSGDACPGENKVAHWGTNLTVSYYHSLDCDNIVQLAQAEAHTLALGSDGKVYGWGSSNHGANGLGCVGGIGTCTVGGTGCTGTPCTVGNNSSSPVELNGSNGTADIEALTGGTSTNVQITTGNSNAAMLVGAGTSSWAIYTWGDDTLGQCGCGTTSTGYNYGDVSQGTSAGFSTYPVTEIDEGGNYPAAGHPTDGHILVLVKHGTNDKIWAWGDNASGQLGNNSTTNSNVPVQIGTTGKVFTDIRAGGEHSMALESNGDLLVWGDNSDNQLGDGGSTNALTPEEVMVSGAPLVATMISAGSLHSVAY
jgi:alpha-tubulin suppressor-like RCC1 family protein